MDHGSAPDSKAFIEVQRISALAAHWACLGALNIADFSLHPPAPEILIHFVWARARIAMFLKFSW